MSIPRNRQEGDHHPQRESPRAPVITPDEPDIRAAIEHAERHPEFTLSRREIIKYVLAEPGERAKEVQALLQLDALEGTRSRPCGPTRAPRD